MKNINKVLKSKLLYNILIMIIMGLLSAVSSRISLNISGNVYAQTDAREIIALMSVFFLPSWIYALGVGFIAALGGPYNALFSTIAMHITAIPAAWFFSDFLKKTKFKSDYLKGVIWFLFVIILYFVDYSFIFVLSESLLGNFQWNNFFSIYANFVRGVWFEAVITSIITAVVFVNVFISSKLKKTTLDLNSAVKQLNSSNNVLSGVNEELAKTMEELEETNEELEETNEELQVTNDDLLESNRKYSDFFNKSYDAMFMVDGMTFIDCNAAAVKMFGLQTKAELLKKSPFDLVPEIQPKGQKSKEFIKQMTNAALENGSMFFEAVYKRKNGETFANEVSLTAIFSDGKFILHSILRDISIRKKS